MGRKRKSETDSYDLVTIENVEQVLNEEMADLGLSPIQRKILRNKKDENEKLYNNELKNTAHNVIQREIELGNGERVTVAEAMVSKQVEKAMLGDTKAFNSLVELAGEKKEVVEHRINKVQEIIDVVVDEEEF